MKLSPSYPVCFTVHCSDVNRIISRIGLADTVHLLDPNRVADLCCYLFCVSLALTSNIDIWSYRNAVLIEPPIQEFQVFVQISGELDLHIGQNDSKKSKMFPCT